MSLSPFFFSHPFVRINIALENIKAKKTYTVASSLGISSKDTFIPCELYFNSTSSTMVSLRYGIQRMHQNKSWNNIQVWIHWWMPRRKKSAGKIAQQWWLYNAGCKQSMIKWWQTPSWWFRSKTNAMWTSPADRNSPNKTARSFPGKMFEFFETSRIFHPNRYDFWMRRVAHNGPTNLKHNATAPPPYSSSLADSQASSSIGSCIILV